MSAQSDSSASDFEGAVGLVEDDSDDSSSSQLNDDGTVGLIVVSGAGAIVLSLRHNAVVTAEAARPVGAAAQHARARPAWRE